MPHPTDEAAFIALLDQHRKILHKVASTFCRTAADRQDCAQEIVAQLWRAWPRYDAEQRFSTWMYRIALNVAISFQRGEARRWRHTVPATDAVLEVAAPAGAEAAAAAARLELLYGRIARLEALDRALVLLYLDGEPHAAIADVLGISATNVGTRIGRIKERLRRDLADRI